MDLGIAGRTAIVCGSSQGLGRGCAEALAEAGVALVLNGRDPDRLARTAEEMRARFNLPIAAVAADVTTPEGQEALLAACPEGPDILVNNAAGPPFRPYTELDRDAMLRGVTSNMVAPIELVQRVVGPMAERGFGRIVNITSASVRMPLPGLDLSSGARAGLTAFLAGVAREVAGRGVTINHLLPGYFDTARLRAGFAKEAERDGEAVVRARWAARVPARRFGAPEEFGRACAFLCSAHAGYITGQSLLLDGGLFPGTF